jgi:hypothetical protein
MDDCDSLMLSAEDALAEMSHIPLAEKQKFKVLDSSELAQCWVNLVKLSIALGRILIMNSKQSGELPTASEIEGYETEIRNCSDLGRDPDVQVSKIVEFHLQQFQLHCKYVFHVNIPFPFSTDTSLSATMIALYRPYLMKDILNKQSISEETWLPTAQQRTRDATANTHSLLDNIAATNMIRFLGPMM